MPVDRASRKPAVPRAIHATAVAIGDGALLIRGESRIGKSRLALALIARSTPALPIRLIGDDRILLRRGPAGLVARPHPRIAGFIERRGLGLVAMPWVAQARIGGVVNLCRSGSLAANPEPVGFDPGGGGLDLPQLTLDTADDAERAARVLAWWAGLTAAWAQHPAGKADGAPLAITKD